MEMRIIDSHCDLLSKMLIDPQINFTEEHHNAAVNLSRLQSVNMALQFYAIFIPEIIKHPNFNHILASIDLFYQKIKMHPDIVFVKDRDDLDTVFREHKIGALLTLENVEALMGSLSNVRIAYYLGVRCMGITWNYANWAADGVLEPRQGGFTEAGKKFVKECNRLGILLDISHLAEAGFWQLVEMSSDPFIASHSNAYEICSHPRNLTNNQIRAIIHKKGMIGLTFVPWFVKTSNAQMTDLLRHIDHICSLGGEDHIGFGSDFDGFETAMPQLEHVGHYNHLINELHKKYTAKQAEKFASINWQQFLNHTLHPKSRFLI
jgi:membrane dipeptidase